MRRGTLVHACEIADEMRMPCGWEIDGNSAYAEPLDAQVNRLEQPRPAPQAAKDEQVPKPQRVA